MKNALPERTRYSFIVGGLSLGLVAILWISSRSTEAWTSIADIEPMNISTGTFTPGSSLYLVLRKASITPAESETIGRTLKRVLNPRGLRRDDLYELQQTKDGTFRRLIITRTLDQYIVEKGSSSHLSVFTQNVPVDVRERSAAGVIKSSLWESLREKDLPPELIMQFADIFAWNLDFLTECRGGDRFSLLFSQDVMPNGKVAHQRIIGATYNGRATGRHVAVLFDGDYYDENGESLRKAFLHAPLNFRRISSGFTQRRFHPILRYFRPHLGIDYAAPRGTPVVSIGDGTVVFKGWKRMYGNYVQIRHNGTYTTGYAHFSRYAKGIRPGVRVRQGQVIGYVGATGHATGPHLDFRVIKNGRFVNFLKLKFPADKKIPPARRDEFDNKVRDSLEQMNDKLLEESELVS